MERCDDIIEKQDKGTTMPNPYDKLKYAFPVYSSDFAFHSTVSNSGLLHDIGNKSSNNYSVVNGDDSDDDSDDSNYGSDSVNDDGNNSKLKLSIFIDKLIISMRRYIYSSCPVKNVQHIGQYLCAFSVSLITFKF